jgi:hypothetical protein
VILRAAKFAELISEISQIFLIYNEIDVKFQRDLFMSKVDIKLNSFLTELNDKKNVWWQLTERKRSENTYETSINNQSQYFYEYIRYSIYQFEYQKFKNDRDESSRYSSYAESQRYDHTYDDNRRYLFRDFLSNYSNYSNDAKKTNFNSNSFYSKFSSDQNDINRTQKSFLNTDQISNENEYQSRSDSFKDTSLKNDSLISDQIRSNWTSRSIQFSLRSNEFDRRNDEYKSKIYNTKINESEFDQKCDQKEYQKKYSQKEQNQDVSMNFAEYDNQKNELYYEETAINSDEKYETFTEFVEIEISCITCKKVFSFRNKLHKHLKNCKSTIRIEKIKKSAQKKKQWKIDHDKINHRKINSFHDE